jgi:hypothetical protein
MRKIIQWSIRHRLILGIFLFLVANHMFDGGPFDVVVNTYAQAAPTTVTATIKDPSGLAYANASINISLTPATPGGATCTGSGPIGQIPVFNTNSNGFFSINLCPNGSIVPASSQWLFTVSLSPGIQLPLGKGPQSFSAAITISGASQDISATLNALAPALTTNGNLVATSAAFATATTAGTCVQSTTAVAGATTSMVATASPVSTPGVGAVWSAFVSSAGNVTINECAVATSAGGTIAFNIRVQQ